MTGQVSSRCKVCGDILLSVQGDEINGQLGCITCAGKKNCNKPGVASIDPGEEFFGKKSDPSKKETVKQAVQVQVPQNTKDILVSVLGLLNSMPMPKDVKQFKKLSKLVSAVNKLILENTDNGY